MLLLVTLSFVNMSQNKINLTQEWVIERLPERPKDANKGTFGKVLVIAGSENYPGAAYLACAGAYRVGAGLVTLVTDSVVQNIVSKKLPEVTFIILPGKIPFKEYNVCLIGPGLGQKKGTKKLVKNIFKEKFPISVIDGDGLNILSKMAEWWKLLKTQAVLTPHPGEMSRLTGLSVFDIQKNRIDITQSFARKWNQVIVLKGANTLIVSPAGETLVSPFANPVLATAGTGDILSGIISGLLAQGLELFDAAGVGVYIHGLAGEMLREKLGNAGILAGDFLPLLPLAIKKLK